MVERAASVGLVPWVLGVAELYLLPVEAKLCWRTLHDEPLGRNLRVCDWVSRVAALLAAVVCAFTLVTPM